MNISFEVVDNDLLLYYFPQLNELDFVSKLCRGESVSIKRTFLVNQNCWLDYEDMNGLGQEDILEFIESNGLRFIIGTTVENYIRISTEVLQTDNTFYFSKENSIHVKHFIAQRNISILRRIDALIERDMYIGGEWDIHEGIPFDSFEEMVNKFPTSYELDKYADYRVASSIKEYFPESDRYELIYEEYRRKKKKAPITTSSIANIEIECAQFDEALSELRKMLEDPAIWENDWQERVRDIILLIYPKYVYCRPWIRLPGVDEHYKIPDFVLVDTNGFIDLMEIKRPNCKILSDRPNYRNNYIPSRDFSGTVQQMEKYIHCLLSAKCGHNNVTASEIAIKTLKKEMTTDLVLDVVNPQGILLLGRSCDFDGDRKRDFELIKRQYNNIVDIMTYDDLINRLNNIVCELKRRKNLLERSTERIED